MLRKWVDHDRAAPGDTTRFDIHTYDDVLEDSAHSHRDLIITG